MLPCRLIIFVLCIATAALAAVPNDISCMVHWDSCGACIKSGCNWCSDGFCVSPNSDVCGANKRQQTCALAVTSHRAVRSQPNCDAIFDCTTCLSSAAAGCTACVDQTTQLFQCSSSSSCVISSPYNKYNQWWESRFPTLLVFENSASCPSAGTAASDSPTLLVTILDAYVTADLQVPPSAVQAFAISLLRLAGVAITADAVFIVEVVLEAGKRSSSPLLGPVTAIATVQFADVGSFTAQGLAATVLQVAGANATLAVNSVPLTANAYLPSTGSGAAVGSSSSSGVNLSKGALAGIIIGCIVGGILLIAIIAYLIMRGRSAFSPSPFRAPSASYRP